MNCDSCDYFFSDNYSFNIHLKNCKNNINTDPKNKYYCPSCDKKFRILPNLEKHNESKKHLNLFEWNKKQLNINTNNHTTKSINLISYIAEKEPEHSSLEQLIRNRDLELQSYKIPKRALSLMFNMRSTDVGLGLGFNLASYGLLLMMIAKQVNMIPGELVYNGGDVHLYSNHIEPIKEQLTRQPYELPTVKLSDRVVNDISEYTLDDIILENYQSHPSIKMPLSN